MSGLESKETKPKSFICRFKRRHHSTHHCTYRISLYIMTFRCRRGGRNGTIDGIKVHPNVIPTWSWPDPTWSRSDLDRSRPSPEPFSTWFPPHLNLIQTWSWPGTCSRSVSHQFPVSFDLFWTNSWSDPNQFPTNQSPSKANREAKNILIITPSEQIMRKNTLGASMPLALW